MSTPPHIWQALKQFCTHEYMWCATCKVHGMRSRGICDTCNGPLTEHPAAAKAQQQVNTVKETPTK